MPRRHRHLSLLIADGNPVFLRGLESIFRLYPGINVVAQCQDGFSVMETIRSIVPDVALLDIAMPGMSGLDLLTRVNVEAIPTRILFLTDDASAATIRNAVSAGAKGILLKHSTPDEIGRGVRRIA